MKVFQLVVAKPDIRGFSELTFPVFPTTSTVAVGLLNTGKDV